MHAELSQQLRDRYPELFIHDADVADDIGCGDGWHGLVDTLFACLAQDNKASESDPAIIVQIKEKFGSLRVYLRNANERQPGMTQLATALSERICEKCGASGRLRILDAIYMTRCDAHSADVIGSEVSPAPGSD